MTRLAVAQSYVRTHVDKGVKCPCCGQHVQRYRRIFNRGMAESLVVMYWAKGKDWQYVPETTSRHSREEGKMRFWGLTELQGGRKKNGSLDGYSRVTTLGERFVRGQAPIRSHIVLLDNELLRREGDLIYIHDVIRGFNYWELMRG